MLPRLHGADDCAGPCGTRRIGCLLKATDSPPLDRSRSVDALCTSPGLAARAGVFVLSAAFAACSSSKPTPTPAQRTDVPQSAALWGDMKPVVSVKELMKYMIDPVADNIFNAVGSTVTEARHGRHRAEDRRGLGQDPDRRGLAGRRRVSPEDPSAVHAARRREQQHGTGRGGTVAGADHREGRARSGGVERANRGAAERRARSPRHRQAKRRQRAVGRRRESRQGV